MNALQFVMALEFTDYYKISRALGADDSITIKYAGKRQRNPKLSEPPAAIYEAARTKMQEALLLQDELFSILPQQEGEEEERADGTLARASKSLKVLEKGESRRLFC